MRVGVSDQSVEAVPWRLGLGLDLQRVIGCPANIAEKRNGVESAIWRHVRRSAGQAAERVARHRAASRWTVGVEVIAGHQDVRAARTGITGGEHHVAGQLVFDVHVPLLDPPYLEVRGLGIERAGKCADRGRRRNGLKSAGEADGGGSSSKYGRAVGGREGASS